MSSLPLVPSASVPIMLFTGLSILSALLLPILCARRIFQGWNVTTTVWYVEEAPAMQSNLSNIHHDEYWLFLWCGGLRFPTAACQPPHAHHNKYYSGMQIDGEAFGPKIDCVLCR